MALDLEPIKKRRAAIGRGNWSAQKSPATLPSSHMLFLGRSEAVFFHGWRHEEVTRFIAHAPADIDALIAEVERGRSAG